MAKMKDPKPTNEGEAKAWQYFADGLPKNYIVYHNRSVNTWEFDFCILAPLQCLFIIEVKGWSPDYVVNVVNSKQINLKNPDGKPAGSPRDQARRYCFSLNQLLKDRYGFNVLVLDLVCYPEISKDDYYRKRLDVVSAENETIFKEELEDPAKLLAKMNQRFYTGDSIHHDFMDDKLYARIRHHFEPDYDLKEDIETLNPGYSRLRVFPESLQDDEINAITDEYFLGVKQLLFVSDRTGFEKVVNQVEQKYKEKNLRFEKGKLVLGAKDIDVAKIKNHYSTFNFDAYLVQDLKAITERPILIEEGITNTEQELVLKQLADVTSFNYQQFQLEHAPTDKNIKVSAGAGTGKTYSMVSRIAYLCNKTIDPVVNLSEDLLMITFTNEAADNMKKRLKQMFMNYFLLTANSKYLRYIEDISQTQISTIHKFAISLLRKTCFYLGLGKDFDIRSEVFERRQIYSRLVNEYLENKVDEDSSFQKKLRVRTYELTDILMRFADQLYNKSVDVKKLSAQDIAGVDKNFMYFNEMLTQIVIPAEKEYFDLLIQNDSIDLRQCMILLQEQVTRHVIRQQDFGFHYVFVDEFQDTDDYQIESLHGLYELLPNYCRLFIVGDLKQSIYRFRGATLTAFEKMEKLCGNWEDYFLNINYRSDRRLLEQFDSVFSNMGANKLLPYEAGDDTLYSRITKQYADSELIKKVEVHQKNTEEFMDILFKEINEQVVRLDKLKSENNLSDEEKTIAILVRYNFQIENIVAEGKKRGVKIYTNEGGDLYRLQPALDLYKLVQALSSPTDISTLLNLLNSNYIKVNLDYAGLGGLTPEEKLTNILQVLDDYFLLRLGKKWDAIVKELYSRPILIVLREIYEKTQPWIHWDLNEYAQLFYHQNYECLLEEIIQRYSRDYLTLNMVNNLLTINITTYQDQPSRELSKKTNEVRIVCMNVHKSKGLEFGTVILPYTNEQIDRLKETRDIVNYENGHLAFSVTLGDIQICNSYYNPSWESMEVAKDESRILYVAMTRTIRNFIWCSDLDTAGSLSWKSLLEVNEA